MDETNAQSQNDPCVCDVIEVEIPVKIELPICVDIPIKVDKNVSCDVSCESATE